MEYRKLGSAGLKVSVVGIGCNNFGMRMDQAATTAVVDAAIAAGINFFDTADVYGASKSETMLGQALAGRRHDVVIATKFGGPMGEGPLHRGGARRHVVAAAEASLLRLGTDYIDLYQQHFPDQDTTVEETLRALEDLVRSGKVRYLGNSNYSGWQIADADWTARAAGVSRFVTAQNNYSLIDRRMEREVLPACERFGLGLLPYFPLASGLLTGKYSRDVAPPPGTRLAAAGALAARALNDRNFVIVEALTAYAAQHDKSLLSLAFAWLLARPAISSVIAGATRAEQVAANAAAADWQLTPDQARQIADLAPISG